VFLAYNMRRGVSILGVSDLIERIKTAVFKILPLARRVERLNRQSSLENFDVVWRTRVDQGRALSIRA
jgi:hypothetical protein